MEALNTNYKRKQTGVGLFELGAVFCPSSPGALPEERLHLGFVACGDVDRGWQEPAQARDFFYAKGIAEKLLEALGISGVSWEPVTGNPTLHPGRAAGMLAAGMTVGMVGELHPEVLQNYELPTRVVACEIDLTSLLPMAQLDARARALPRYPGSARDLALHRARGGDGRPRPGDHPECRRGRCSGSAACLTSTRAPRCPPAARSLAYSLLFQSLERTLTEEEVAAALNRILAALEALGVRIR